MRTFEIIQRMNELAQHVESNMVDSYHGESSIDPDCLAEWQERIASFQALMEEAIGHLEAACDLEG